MKWCVLVFALAATVVLGGCASQPTQADDEQTIHALIRDWSAASGAKDAKKFASFYAEDASLMLAGAPDMRGLDAVREGITGMMQDPNFNLSFVADEVVVSKSGDLAYETGSYSLAMSGPNGDPIKEKGHYVVVWEKQKDGAWKVVIDAPISDP